jgi:hypothetical protein
MRLVLFCSVKKSPTRVYSIVVSGQL